VAHKQGWTCPHYLEADVHPVCSQKARHRDLIPAERDPMWCWIALPLLSSRRPHTRRSAAVWREPLDVPSVFCHPYDSPVSPEGRERRPESRRRLLGGATPAAFRSVRAPPTTGLPLATAGHPLAEWGAECGSQIRRTGRPHRQPEPRPGPARWIRWGMARSWQARTPRAIWFSDAHEAEAKEAELRKPPSRFGKWVLRRLGYRGDLKAPAPQARTRHPHERSVHEPPGNRPRT
jgi:hypothetical protein